MSRHGLLASLTCSSGSKPSKHPYAQSGNLPSPKNYLRLKSLMTQPYHPKPSHSAQLPRGLTHQSHSIQAGSVSGKESFTCDDATLWGKGEKPRGKEKVSKKPCSRVSNFMSVFAPNLYSFKVKKKNSRDPHSPHMSRPKKEKPHFNSLLTCRLGIHSSNKTSAFNA